MKVKGLDVERRHARQRGDPVVSILPTVFGKVRGAPVGCSPSEAPAYQRFRSA